MSASTRPPLRMSRSWGAAPLPPRISQVLLGLAIALLALVGLVAGTAATLLIMVAAT